MNTFSRRLAAAFLLAAMALTGLPALSNAATSPWSWTDISNQLTVRNNRPVWAMAYANGNWFYTDGLDLWNGGQVYRYDGMTQVNITLEVRTSGLSRVDDIVTDGQTVYFLKNVMARNNTIEALSYTNGSYGYRTGALRNILTSDEGIASLVGKNGSWTIVTTRGRILSWDGQSPSASQWNAQSAYSGSIEYSVRKTSPSDNQTYFPIAVAPVANGWFYAIRELNGTYRFWRRDANGIATDITSSFASMSFLQAIASNGSTVLFAGGDFSSSANRVYTYDGSTVRDVTSQISTAVVPGTAWYRSIIHWDGKRWVMYSGKRVMTMLTAVDEPIFVDTMRDYFLTVASNGFGTTLLGGVESNLGLEGPVFPLQAKLVKLAETSNVPQNPSTNNTNVQTSNGISAWSWVEPSQSFVRRDQNITFGAGAWSDKGIKTIDLVVNGVTRNTCHFANAMGNQQCTYSIWGGEFALGTNVAVNAKITNGSDQVLWTDVKNLNVTDTNGQTNNTSGDLSTWTTLEPTGSTLSRSNTVNFRVSASATRGLSRIDVYANGSTIRTCYFSTAYGTQTCDATVAGSSYSAGTQLTLNSKATDLDGRIAWSDNKLLSVQDNGSTNSNTSVWTWSEPETSQIKTNESAKFFVGAYDQDGISKIEFFVNGTLWNTCFLGNAYGNQQCSVTVNGSSFTAGSDVFVNAKATDSQGNIAWSASRSYRVNAADGSTPAPTTGSNPTSSWVWSDPEKSSLVSGDVSTFHIGAWDNDGLSRMDIWVNGVVKQTCSFGTAFGNRECSFAIYANDYKAGTNVFVNAAIVDAKGETTWSASRSYAITSSNSNGQAGDGSSNLPGSIQVTSNRDNGFTANDTITVSANAQDQNGLRRIDLFVNGTLYKTCANTGSCSVTVGPFPTRTSISYGATVVDNSGFAIWTGYKTVYKK